MNPGAWLANSLWQASAWPDWWTFRRNAADVRSVQLKLLKTSLAHLARTDYARSLGLTEEWSYPAFAQGVPLVSYKELQPYLSSVQGLLTDPVKVWEPTGGSTGGSKWIPWTAGLQAQFRKAVNVWIFEMFRKRPALKRGRGYWQLTPKTPVQPPDWLEGRATGFESDGEYLGWLGRSLEKWVTVPVSSKNGDLWDNTVGSLTRSADLTLISCWSPSFLQVLSQKMIERCGRWSPQEWWPDLKLISCWTQGPSATYLPFIEELFPGVEIHGKGLLSTEAVTTVPVGESYPLAYHSHFFEFLSDCGDVYPCWELEQNRCYEVVQTTAGGLVRYRSGDWVRVTDFYGDVPCLEFLTRDGVCDHFGEKLSFRFLRDSLSEFNHFARVGFESDGYVLFLDGDEGVQDCYHHFNRCLKEVFTYRDCLELGQLQELRLFVLEDSGLEQFAPYLDLADGRRKPDLLLPDGVWSERLKGEFWNL